VENLTGAFFQTSATFYFSFWGCCAREPCRRQMLCELRQADLGSDVLEELWKPGPAANGKNGAEEMGGRVA
jgi:hypothetical protein